MKVNILNSKFIILVILIFSISQSSYSQIFVEANVGINGAINPIMYKPSHSGFGIGYMYQDLYGVRGVYAKDNFLQSNFKRVNMEVVLNISNIVWDKSYYDRLFLLGHFGGGISNMTTTTYNVSDTNFNLVAGLTPRYRIADGLNLTLDGSMIINPNQNYKFNGMKTVGDIAAPEIGYLFNLSIGLMYTFGDD